MYCPAAVAVAVYGKPSAAGLAQCLHAQGVEIGSGFGGARMLGSEHNDSFYMQNGHVRTRTNRCLFHWSSNLEGAGCAV